jgi:hypothetical protein
LQGADRVEALRALLKNTTVRAAVALLLAIFCGCLLSACAGDSSGSAQALLDETFSGHKQIESGNVKLSLGLGASGSSTSPKPLAVTLSGPFESAAGKLPRFAFQLQLGAAGHSLQAGATSTGSALFVELAGTWFSTPSSTYKALEESYTQATKKASSAKVRSTFSSLGIEPGRWLSNPTKLGTVTVGGEATIHLLAAVNIPAFLADVTKLSQAGSSLGLNSVPGAPSASGTLSPSVINELAKSIKSAHVDVYTGESDHMLRRLEVTAAIAGTPQTQGLFDGLSSANLTVQLEFSDLNKKQTISAPEHVEPSSQLLPALQQLVGVLEGTSSSGISSGTLEELSKG